MHMKMFFTSKSLVLYNGALSLWFRKLTIIYKFLLQEILCMSYWNMIHFLYYLKDFIIEGSNQRHSTDKWMYKCWQKGFIWMLIYQIQIFYSSIAFLTTDDRQLGFPTWECIYTNTSCGHTAIRVQGAA